MKQYKDFNLAQMLLSDFIQFIEKKLYKRKWTYEDQVRHASLQIVSDHQWMSHDNIVSEVNYRHSKMLSDKWYTTNHEPQDAFRCRIGLNPHSKKEKQ